MAGKQNRSKPKTTSTNWRTRVGHFIWHGSRWRKALVIIISFTVRWMAVCYGVARWYIVKHANEPLVIGTTFISDYAKSFGLSPEQTLRAIFKELGIKQIRLVSYWK